MDSHQRFELTTANKVELLDLYRRGMRRRRLERALPLAKRIARAFCAEYGLPYRDVWPAYLDLLVETGLVRLTYNHEFMGGVRHGGSDSLEGDNGSSPPGA